MTTPTTPPATPPPRDHSTVHQMQFSFLRRDPDCVEREDPHDLMSVMRRRKCPSCKKLYKYYCYRCMLPFEPPHHGEHGATPNADRDTYAVLAPREPTSAASSTTATATSSVVPLVHLPIRCVVIQHPNECKSKSTAVHAKLLAPHTVDIYQYPEIPQEVVFTERNALLLYPCKDAVPVSHVVREISRRRAEAKKRKNKGAVEQQQQEDGEEPGEGRRRQCVSVHNGSDGGGGSGSDSAGGNQVQYVIFIDSTWQQSKAILRDPRLAQVRRVKIGSHKTCFWRYQNFGDDFLATIEAIYFFYREYATFENMLREGCLHREAEMAQEEMEQRFYYGEYDDLLFYFVFMYKLIQGIYRKDRSKKFNHIRGWVNYNDNLGDADRLQQQAQNERLISKLSLSDTLEKK